ncbi:hypothetical protein C8R44DRAFT_737146 [Mycena epipterygia]|nr:hypothetical protein C8R44DRAFT_737146 [Mycena epipterygia]
MPRTPSVVVHRSQLTFCSASATEAQCVAGTGADFVHRRTPDLRARNKIIMKLRWWEQDPDPAYSARVKQRPCANGIRKYRMEWNGKQHAPDSQRVGAEKRRGTRSHGSIRQTCKWEDTDG